MSIASSGDIVFDLVLPDKSSGNLEREIVGKWQPVDVLNREQLNTLTEDSMMEFTRNGTVKSVNPGAENNEEPLGVGTYELIGEKLIVDDGGYFNTLIVSSIGDLLFIREAGLDYGGLYARR